MPRRSRLSAPRTSRTRNCGSRWNVEFDDAGGNIGRRYRRQDEIGTPWCVTIDFDTIEKPGDTFTLRERDSMAQKRITEAELFALLEEQVY